MKSRYCALFVLLAATWSTAVLGVWAAFARVIPEDQQKFGIRVNATEVNEQFKFAIALRKEPGLCSATRFGRQAWLVEAREPLSATEQSRLRYELWGVRESDAEAVPPGWIAVGKESFRAKSKWVCLLEVLVPKSSVGRSYIVIDYPYPVYDGGYYYAIDLSEFVERSRHRAPGSSGR
jgi:hypothetical protein